MIVETATGKVEGIAVEVGAGEGLSHGRASATAATTATAAAADGHREVLQFRGIPFALAQRFRPPEPPVPWAGVRDASRFGPMAPQMVSAMDRLLGLDGTATGEDCLVLNVFTPAADDGRRPVMVWLHGGGFTQGCGHLPHYDGSRLAGLGDVVVVTVNYRLGVLGFLYLDHLLAEAVDPGDPGGPGVPLGSGANGLRDQIAALRWVRDNIAGFGGDPERVTLFGESAGAMSVATLMAMGEATGLFHAAITQSGAADNLLSPDAAMYVTEEVLRRFDLSPTAGAIEALREVPVERLVRAQTEVMVSAPAGPGPEPAGPPSRPRPRFLQLPLQPVADGQVVPSSPLARVRDGSAAGIPLVAGTNADEWRLFMLQDGYDEIEEERLHRRAARLVGEDAAEEAVALYREARPDENRSLLWASMVTDYVFRRPAIRLAEAQLPHAATSMYRFDHPTSAFDGLPGACHAIEIPFVFDNVHLPGIEMLLGGVDEGTRRLATRCATAWAAAARSGRPEHAGLPWPGYDRERRATCILHRSPEVADDPEGDLRRFWQALPDPRDPRPPDPRT